MFNEQSLNMCQVHDNIDKDLLEPIQNRLISLLQGLLETQPRNFIGHRTWAQIEKILALCVVAKDSRLSALLAYVNGRNNSFATAISIQQVSLEQQLVDLLDQTIMNGTPPGLARNCWNLGLANQQLTRTVLDWAVYTYRPGLSRLYVAVRLLRNWSRTGLDVTEAVLDYMSNAKALNDSTSSALYSLVAELARPVEAGWDAFLAAAVEWCVEQAGLPFPE